MSGGTYTAFAFPQADYYFSQLWTLDLITYNLTFRYNERVKLWFVDLADASDAPLVQGVALRASRSLLAPYATRAVPKGVLAVFDATGANLDPGPDSFSTTHSLIYRSPV